MMKKKKSENEYVPVRMCNVDGNILTKKWSRGENILMRR